MNTFKRTLFFIGLTIISFGLFAQTVEEAGAKYNEGNTALKEKKYSNAVSLYEDALKTAEDAGPDAADLKGNIEKQLMSAYYKNGLSLYKKRSYDDAVANLEKSNKLAEQLGNAAMTKKNVTYIARVLSTKGNSLVKEGKLDEAYAEYEKAHAIKPDCVNSFYGKGLVYKERGDMAKMMESMDEAIKYGADNPKAAKTVAKAKKTASKTLVNEAAREIQKERGANAVKYINDSFKYAEGNADSFYYLTIAYNKTKQFGEAVTSANKAIEMKEGDKSDIYFELGQALEGKGDAAGACNAYKQVTSGPNVEAAKYQITQSLKCG